jgi:hypothetical protein
VHRQPYHYRFAHRSNSAAGQDSVSQKSENFTGYPVGRAHGSRVRHRGPAFCRTEERRYSGQPQKFLGLPVSRRDSLPRGRRPPGKGRDAAPPRRTMRGHNDGNLAAIDTRADRRVKGLVTTRRSLAGCAGPCNPCQVEMAPRRVRPCGSNSQGVRELSNGNSSRAADDTSL